MGYQKIGVIIRNSTPREKTPKLSEEQIERIKTASTAALIIIGVAGAVALSAIAPNILVAIGKIFLKKSPKKRFSKKEKDRKISKTIYYLKSSGLIRMRPTKHDFVIYLTSRGKKRLDKLSLDTITVSKPKSWDGKWWQIAADIPTEDYRWAADLFRDKLKELKFYPLQRTLWFYPYDPRKEIEFIIQTYGIERFVTVMEINRLDRDDEHKIKKYFQVEKIL